MAVRHGAFAGRSAAGLAQRDRRAEVMRWGLSFAAVAAIQGALVLGYLKHDEPPPANEAPEAAVMIDLPPELALPPAESVESVASSAAEEVDAPDAAEPPPPDTAEPLPDAAPTQDAPPETVEDIPEIDLSDDTPPDEAQAVVEDAVPEEPPTEDVGAAEPDAVEAVPPDEVVAAEVALPPPPKATVPPRPKPAAKPKPPVRAAKAPARATPAPPQRREASRAAVAGQRASGAGAPDANALSRYKSSVRAAIIRQKPNVSVAGGGRTAAVSFVISASGAVGGVSLVKSTGDATLDAAAVSWVRRAGPFPPIPAGVGTSLRPTIPLRFD